jgi:hypothetical protein
MRIEISADPYNSGIKEFDKSDAYIIEFGDSNLPSTTWDEFKTWHEKYMPYTDIKDDRELIQHKTLLETLDNEGLRLTRKIAKEWTDLSIDKFFYFSYGFYYAVSVDREGNEHKIEKPTREDWGK